MKNLTFILIAFLLITGCDDSFYYNQLDSERTMVIRGSLDNEGKVSVFVSASHPVTSTITSFNDLNLSDCRVEIILNEQIIRELSWVEDHYSGNLSDIIQPTDSVQLKVCHKDFECSFSQKLTFPEMENLKIDHIRKTSYLYSQQDFWAMDLSLKSNESPSYYMINTNDPLYVTGLYSYLFESECGIIFHENYMLFSDACLKSLVSIPIYISNRDKTVEDISTDVTVSAVSRDFYKMIKSFQLPEAFESGFLKPRIYHSNMTNALGVFDLHTVETLNITLPHQ